MTKPDYLPEAFIVGMSFLGAACLTLVSLILTGIIPWKEAVQTLGGVAVATIGVLGAVSAAYLAHSVKVKHDRHSIAKALVGEVAAIRTWLFNACKNPPDWNKASLEQQIWSEAVRSLRPPPLTIYGPQVFTAIGSLDHSSVIKFVEFRGYCETLTRMIDMWSNQNPARAREGIHTLMKLLDTVGRQADDVVKILATNFDVKISFDAPWP